MRNDVTIIDPDGIEWSQSKTAPSGCWGKPIYRYDEGRLGTIGRAGPYTTQYRFEANSFYRPFRVLGQPVELFVMSGVLRVDEVEVQEGQWARVLPGDAPAVIGSVSGAEIIAIVRGEVELMEKANLGEQK